MIEKWISIGVICYPRINRRTTFPPNLRLKRWAGPVVCVPTDLVDPCIVAFNHPHGKRSHRPGAFDHCGGPRNRAANPLK